MGVWLHKGFPKRSFKVLHKTSGKISTITPEAATNEENVQDQAQVVTLKRVYYVNKSSLDLRKIISTLQGRIPLMYLCLLVKYEKYMQLILPTAPFTLANFAAIS